jgi:hypothetical protein
VISLTNSVKSAGLEKVRATSPKRQRGKGQVLPPVHFVPASLNRTGAGGVNLFPLRGAKS